MAKSALVTIFFGIILQDELGHKLLNPWQRDGYKCEVEWWARFTGFVPVVEVYDERGELLEGKHPGKDVMERYFLHRREWVRQHPTNFTAFELSGHKSGYTALCVNLTRRTLGAHCGTLLKPLELVVPPAEVEAFSKVCVRMGFEAKPDWHCIGAAVE
jgi:hypothetical protein